MNSNLKKCKYMFMTLGVSKLYEDLSFEKYTG